MLFNFFLMFYPTFQTFGMKTSLRVNHILCHHTNAVWSNSLFSPVGAMPTLFQRLKSGIATTPECALRNINMTHPPKNPELRELYNRTESKNN